MRCMEWSGSARLLALSAVAAATFSAQAAAEGMKLGGLTSQPIGHYEFCRDNPTECSARPRDLGPEPMTGALWSQLVSVNRAVNSAVRPMNDFDIYGKDEVWAYPANGVGDCEDYVLEKRRDLSQMGLSLANLLITVVRKPDGEGHAVLTVRTTKGDMILDNLRDGVLPWKDTEYRYLKRQASTNTGQWVTIREEAAPLVSSVE